MLASMPTPNSSSFQFPDISRLWARTKMVYNHTEYVGDRLKSQYNTYTTVYKNICRFFSKFYGRNPTELSDLEDILEQRHRNSCATSRIFLEDADFDAIEDLLKLTNSLREMHNVLMSDIMRILARDHSRFLEQPTHNRRFNKVLRCVHDSKLAIESIYADTKLSTTRDSNTLPPHEKIWYVYCLVERETLSISNLLESVESWERNVLNNSLDSSQGTPYLPYIKVLTSRQLRPKRLCERPHKPVAKDTVNTENWPQSLRSYGGVSNSTSFDWKSVSEQHMRACVLDPVPCRSTALDISDTLKVHKWNLREPAQCGARLHRPLCNNKASILRSKQAVSKPHGLLRPYHAKISNASETWDRTDGTVRVDPASGRIIKDATPHGDAIMDIDKKLANLQIQVEQLMEERDRLEHRIMNPAIRLVQMEHGVDWLKSVHSKKYNDIEKIQSDINKLKSEKNMFSNSNRF